MFVHYSLNFVGLNLFNLGTETASQRRDSLEKPTAVTVLIRAPAGIVKLRLATRKHGTGWKNGTYI